MMSFYTLAVSTAALASLGAAAEIEPLQFLNVVRTDRSCNLDGDCKVDDLAWIEGRGKPTRAGDICCATFPRETWDDVQAKYVKL